jgi:hypothetical protein
MPIKSDALFLWLFPERRRPQTANVGASLLAMAACWLGEGIYPRSAAQPRLTPVYLLQLRLCQRILERHRH